MAIGKILLNLYIEKIEKDELEKFQKEEELIELGKTYFFREQRGKIMGQLLAEGKKMSELNITLEKEWSKISKEKKMDYGQTQKLLK